MSFDAISYSVTCRMGSIVTINSFMEPATHVIPKFITHTYLHTSGNSVNIM